MKRIILLASYLLCLTTLLSCSSKELSPIDVELKAPVSSDVVICDLKITPVSSLRSGVIEEDVISFEDEVSGEEYHYTIAKTTDGNFSLTFENKSVIDSMTLSLLSNLGNNYVISGKYQDRDLITGVSIETLENGGATFELNNNFGDFDNNNLRVIYYESWWDCVKRITLNEDTAMGTILVGPLTKGRAAIVIAGAAGIICLRQSERMIHHIDNSPGEIRPM